MLNRTQLYHWLFLIGALAVPVSKTIANNEPYPYDNPVITNRYTADASPHVMPDGRVWMVTSIDSEQGGGYSTMHAYHLFSSANMADWVDHGEVFHLNDIHPNEDPSTDDWALWAPDMVYRHGKYYLYYPVRIVHRKDLDANGNPKKTKYIGVAVANTLGERFTVLKDQIAGTAGIDPSVFVDDDDRVYLYWGQKWAGKLKLDMSELNGEKKRLNIGIDNFMEAPWLHKRGGKYYFNYHTKYDSKLAVDNPDDPARRKSHLDYAVGDNPMGPFDHKGVMNYELGYNVTDPDAPKYPGQDYVPWRLTQSNHGGVVEFHGQDYLFYHTSALSSWIKHQFQNKGVWTQRSICVDKLDYQNNGDIIPVKQTIKSVEPVSITQPFAIKISGTLKFKPGKYALKLKGVALGSGYYYFDAKAVGNFANLSGYLEIRLDKANGPLAGSLRIGPSLLNQRNGVVDTFLRGAKQKRDVFLVYKPASGSAPKLKLKAIRFFAGAPKDP